MMAAIAPATRAKEQGQPLRSSPPIALSLKMSQIASQESTAAPQFGYGNVDAITIAASPVINRP
jgi:hypothetical protein